MGSPVVGEPSLGLALDVDPSTALSIPDVVAAGQEWNELAARTVVLDRLRLATLLRDRTDEPQRMAQVVAWTRETLDLLRERG